MRLVLDLQAAQSRTFGERGIARWSPACAAALVRAGAPVEAVLLNPSAPPPAGPLPPELDRPGLVRWSTSAVRRGLAGDDVAVHLLSPFERGRPVDAAVAGPLVAQTGALVLTLYDAIPFALAGWYLADGATRRFMHTRRRVLERADLLLAISDHARAEGIEQLGLDPDRVVAVGSGADPWWSPATDPAAERAAVAAGVPALRDPARFVFTVAGWLPHKNPLALIDGWGRVPAAVRAGRQLVITCAVPPEAHGLVAARVAEAGLGPDEVVLTGRIDDVLLRSLYRCCELFVFASLHEGYGLPVLEAARCGAPAVTSSATSIPEVLDCPASTFEATDPDAIASSLHDGLVDAERRATLLAASARAAATHTWDAVAERAVAAYGRLDGDLGGPRRRRRRSARPGALAVALVAPLPPAPSGVATYTARIAGRLGARVRLDCFAELAPWEAGTRPYRHLPVGAFGGSLDPWAYDVVVHVIGNSDHHVAAAALALRHPGVLWLHETRLDALARLLGHHGDLLADLVAASRAVVVHTEAAAAAVRALAAPSVEVVVVPHAIATRGDLGVGVARTGDVAQLVCFGVVDPAKQPEVVVEAAALVAAHRPLRLAFVGPASEAQRAAVLAQAEVLGLGGSVELTGHVTAAGYGRWLARADLAVQLRAGTGGEASGTVADAIGAGVPVVTSVASAADLPHGVVAGLAPGSPSTVVAATISRLLDDPAARLAMARAQADLAARWSPDVVADQLAELLSRPSWQGVGGEGQA